MLLSLVMYSTEIYVIFKIVEREGELCKVAKKRIEKKYKRKEGRRGGRERREKEKNRKIIFQSSHYFMQLYVNSNTKKKYVKRKT